MKSGSTKARGDSKKRAGISKFNKLRSISRLRVIFFVIALNIICIPTIPKFETGSYNRYTISVNGVCVGVTDDISKVQGYYCEVRRMMASESENMVMASLPEVTYTAEAVITGTIDSDEKIIENMYAVISPTKVQTLSHAYMIKVGDECYVVGSAEEAKQFFEDAISEYDVQNVFDVDLVADSNREFNVLVADIHKNENPDEDISVSENEAEIIEEIVNSESISDNSVSANSISENEITYSCEDVLLTAGFETDYTLKQQELDESSKTGFDAYDYGIESIGFSRNIEIVEAYVPSEQIMDLAYVEDILLNEQEIQQIYTVQAGDTLSGISLKVGLPMSDLIALNSALDNEYSIINIDQKLIITVPEPSLSVIWTEQAKLEEAYNLPTEYIYNDSWYTTDSVTRQQPSAGYHEAVLLITHENNTVTSKETLYEVVLKEPVAKIVEVGTIIPPTYIKPIAGGRLSSTFGGRASPGGIGSTNHKGIDWATPTGTPVYASSGGTVSSAGWRGGYGYCIDIRHPDGKTTRYAHLSKIYVSAGQYVSQGEVIAASGNTGNSTGPHIHFEIIVNGVQVNPFIYL